MKTLLHLLATCCITSVQAQDHQAMDHSAHHGHHNMQVDAAGAVMNENHDQLPRDCKSISRDYQFTVRAGREWAKNEPGAVFAMDQAEIRVEPCSRIELTFINEDEVRHQWMVHGLPKYLYPAGMFHIEAVGGQQKTGTFIVPGDDQTFLLHCDLPQHMEKGMRGQLVVGKGSGNLWGINGISDDFFRSAYLPSHSAWWLAFMLLTGIVLTILLKPFKR